ncbi:MAG: tRNA (adenine(22)-N(1))-methyltransferase TrmK, partial [Candidatus Omnitrophota bacterium]
MNSKAYFMDFELETEGKTLFPRFETEILVEKAIEIIKENKASQAEYNILDIGTGSGNIAISLTKYAHSSKMVALDICDDALRIAKKNAEKYGLEKRIKFIKSNVFSGLSSLDKNFFDL